MLEIESLTPAPWVCDERVGTVGVFAGQPPECLTHECPRCIASKSASWDTSTGISGWSWNDADIADMQFIALARNAFDVMMRRGWYSQKAKNEKFVTWYVWDESDSPAIKISVQDSAKWNDPFTALVEADKWYKANIEEQQPCTK